MKFMTAMAFMRESQKEIEGKKKLRQVCVMPLNFEIHPGAGPAAPLNYFLRR
jgi:hypothetical protein